MNKLFKKPLLSIFIISTTSMGMEFLKKTKEIVFPEKKIKIVFEGFEGFSSIIDSIKEKEESVKFRCKPDDNNLEITNEGKLIINPGKELNNKILLPDVENIEKLAKLITDFSEPNYHIITRNNMIVTITEPGKIQEVDIKKNPTIAIILGNIEPTKLNCFLPPDPRQAFEYLLNPSEDGFELLEDPGNGSECYFYPLATIKIIYNDTISTLTINTMAMNLKEMKKNILKCMIKVAYVTYIPC